MKTSALHNLFLKSTGIGTDTRNITPGSLFFALKGQNFNANNFAVEALQKGAAFAVVDETLDTHDERIILVNDVLESLQDLATYHRRSLKIPIIALTGSNGKTTTKELILAALSAKYKTSATRGNLNNHIGVPLTLLGMDSSTEIGVVEMGANHLEEIKLLCQIAQPDFGYITNFGKAHLEGFGSVEGVIKGKSELYDYLKEHNKILFLNYDDPIQVQHLSHGETFTFGENPSADVQIKYIQHGSYASIEVKDKTINSKLTGSYNAKNMAAACTIATYFGVSIDNIKQALESYQPGNNRSQIIERGNVEIILDAYNANPTSMAAAIDNLVAMKKSPKAAILGDMFEMGSLAEEEHQQIVQKLEDARFDKVYLIGENFFRTTTSGPILKFKTFEDFSVGFNPAAVKDAVVLIKGSRGMALERTLEFL